MIYDCFTYFNEDLILDLRFNILFDEVDYFVIIEGSKTHSGRKKKKNKIFFYRKYAQQC
jgi:beta-1,4-mannosyl-glycoprotein beta-1,4-N-acetylglucosaminyltransferase